MKQKILACLLVLTSLIASGKELIVTGSYDLYPIPGVTILTESGYIVGITDNNGKTDLPDNVKYPLTLRSLGFEIYTLAAPADTVTLKTVAYQLPEISVSAAERPVKRMLCFAREYSTGTTSTDTMQLYSEYMFEYFIADSKVKGYHKSDAQRSRMKNVKRYARIAHTNAGDSIFSPAETDEITIISFAKNSGYSYDIQIEEPQVIRNGATTDTLPGKYSIKTIYHKNGDRFTCTTDYLSDKKNHSYSPNVFKLLGCTIDLNTCNSTTCFQQNENGVYGPYDMLFQATNIEIHARGKVFRWILKTSEPMKMRTTIEIYPVEITSHTLSEYQEMRKDNDTVPFQLPATLLPEIPAAANLKQALSHP